MVNKAIIIIEVRLLSNNLCNYLQQYWDFQGSEKSNGEKESAKAFSKTNPTDCLSDATPMQVELSCRHSLKNKNSLDDGEAVDILSCLYQIVVDFT